MHRRANAKMGADASARVSRVADAAKFTDGPLAQLVGGAAPFRGMAFPGASTEI